MSNRDEQFAGFALAAFGQMLKAAEAHVHGDELDLGSEEAQHAMLQALARAAYDLVEHVMDFQQTEEYGDIDAIPDLPVLPVNDDDSIA